MREEICGINAIHQNRARIESLGELVPPCFWERPTPLLIDHGRGHARRWIADLHGDSDPSDDPRQTVRAIARARDRRITWQLKPLQCLADRCAATGEHVHLRQSVTAEV